MEFRNYLMEMWGVFALCYIGGMSTFWATPSAITGAMAHMLALGIMIYVGAATSGANFNPAVSIAMLATKNLNFMDFLMYVVFQFLGGFLAGLMVWVMSLGIVLKKINKSIPDTPAYVSEWSDLYCTSYPAVVLNGENDAKATTKVINACIAEFIATFFLVFMVFGTAVDKRAPPSVFGFAIGGVVAMSAVGIGSISGAALNPTRWLGPWIVGLWGCPGQSWHAVDDPAQQTLKYMTSAGLLVYTVFPMAGGAVAGIMYNNMFLG
jgi:aquaporin Z